MEVSRLFAARNPSDKDFEGMNAMNNKTGPALPCAAMRPPITP